MSGKLSGPDVKALALAVDMMADWRGSYVGNPDPAPLAHFDMQLAKARTALKKLRVVVRNECQCKVCRAERKAALQDQAEIANGM